MKTAMNHDRFLAPPGKKISLKSYDPGFSGNFRSKEDAEEKLKDDIGRLTHFQEMLYAQNTYALLIIIQGIDAAGKDGVIKHVMSGVNPQGCRVVSFKQPSHEELDHDYLWRCSKALPGRGRIGIFNRSYYEELLIVRVHPELLDDERLPPGADRKAIWKDRFDDICAFERHLVRNGTVVLKFFLHVSKEEQKRRFMDRLTDPDKYWKFSPLDVRERSCWDGYTKAYEEMLCNTSTKTAPWYVIPADHKWFTRVAVADVVVQTLKSLNLDYPKMTREQEKNIKEALKMLKKEK
jgi:PPK2 family polyphosphate:nucleotide phosphotransferase